MMLRLCTLDRMVTIACPVVPRVGEHVALDGQLHRVARVTYPVDLETPHALVPIVDLERVTS